MTTLRRELIQTVFNILGFAYQDNPPTEDAEIYNKEQAEKIADAVLELRAFQKKESLKSDLAKKSPEAAILMGMPIHQENVDEQNLAFEAMDVFERDMGCPKNWNWFPAKTSEESAWRILREFVIEQYKKNPKCFQTYQTWRTQPFARGAMSNLAIKRNPENFPASWTDFLASNAMYGQKRQEVQTDDNGTPISY